METTVARCSRRSSVAAATTSAPKATRGYHPGCPVATNSPNETPVTHDPPTRSNASPSNCRTSGASNGKRSPPPPASHWWGTAASRIVPSGSVNRTVTEEATGSTYLTSTPYSGAPFADRFTGLERGTTNRNTPGPEGTHASADPTFSEGARVEPSLDSTSALLKA